MFGLHESRIFDAFLGILGQTHLGARIVGRTEAGPEGRGADHQEGNNAYCDSFSVVQHVLFPLFAVCRGFFLIKMGKIFLTEVHGALGSVLENEGVGKQLGQAADGDAGSPVVGERRRSSRPYG